MTEFLSADYWNERYLNNASQWDLGAVSPPLKKYIDQKLNKDLFLIYTSKIKLKIRNFSKYKKL